LNFQIRKILVGDETLSVLEIWGAEYQEADALLIKPEDIEFFSSLCQREGCPVAYVGTVTGDGRVVVHDEKDNSTPFDLELDHVLGKMPRKTFTSNRVKIDAKPLSLSLSLEAKTESDHNAATKAILDRVLRLLSVGSKRFLTSKVDRCVSGLVAQQQCVGPLHIPLANNAVIAQRYIQS
jgi:phosphoribosylformylglycinamidine synthase